MTCNVESTDMQIIKDKIEKLQLLLKYWIDKEFDAIMESDRLRQELYYFESKVSLISNSNDSLNI
jgi:hypothetical protein